MFRAYKVPESHIDSSVLSTPLKGCLAVSSPNTFWGGGRELTSFVYLTPREKMLL